MTTIAYKDGVMVADGRITLYDGIISDNLTKIVKLSDGALLAVVGEFAYAASIRRHLEDEDVDLPTGDSFKALLVETDGTIKLYEGEGDFYEVPADRIALGSGGHFAYGAMEMGATAEEAVAVAIKRDPCSGGRVQVLRLNEETE